MVRKLHKEHKILLDENMPNRSKLSRLNGIFHVLHIRDDLRKTGLKDPEVYNLAKENKRILVTFNGNDFRKLVKKTDEVGVISVPATMSLEKIDKNLSSLFIKSTESTFRGKFILLSKV